MQSCNCVCFNSAAKEKKLRGLQGNLTNAKRRPIQSCVSVSFIVVVVLVVVVVVDVLSIIAVSYPYHGGWCTQS